MGKAVGSEPLGSLYSAGKVRRRREWRGLRDTMYDYFRWLGIYPFYDGRYDGLLQGNLGQSTKYGQPVIEVLVEPMKNTIFINICYTTLFWH